MLQNFFNHEAVKKLVKKTFPKNDVETIERPHSYVIWSRQENGNSTARIIVLPPHGCTANNFKELSSHEEARKAKVVVVGTLRDGKKNPSLIKNCLLFSYLTSRGAITEAGVPYALISDNKNIHKEKILSSKQTLYVVKENGEGFYHNLINTTDEPLLLLLTKELKSGKQMDIAKRVDEFSLSVSDKKLILELITAIQQHGDELFALDGDLINKALNIEADILVPILIEALNIHETGKHEPCTVYALILKMAKTNKEIVVEYLNRAIGDHIAPQYYLTELAKKLTPTERPQSSPRK